MKIKVFCKDLKIGMYISELDRPWIESPFLFQGFTLKDNEEVQQVNETCEYVYVDTEKTPFEIASKLTTNTKNAIKQNSNKSDFTDTITLNKTNFNKETFTENLKVARKTRDKTRSYIDDMLNQSRMGEIVDTQKAKELVAEMANNIAVSIDASLWLTQLKNRDEYTAIHSLNVCVLTLTFGRALQLPEEQLNEVGLGALLHDIGKMRVPLKVLNKPGKLTDDEFEIMKSHPGIGYELIRQDKNLSKEVLTIVRNHHERMNGQGYPDKLAGDDISYFTKIVSITDVYDAITSDRCYHDSMSPHTAMQRLYEWMPDNFDRELLQKFIKTMGIYPIGSVVELKTGHIGAVVKLNEGYHLKPVIMLVMDKNKTFLSQRKLINLASTVWEKEEIKPEIKRVVDPKEYGIDVKKIINEESLG